MLCSNGSTSRARIRLPPAPETMAPGPGRVARDGRAVRTATARGSRRPRPLEPSSNGVRACWVAGRPRGSSALSCRADIAADPASLSASLLFGNGEPANRRSPGGVVAPSEACSSSSTPWSVHLRATRRQHPAEHAGKAEWLDARRHLHLGVAMPQRSSGDTAPIASQALSTIDMLPLVRVTAFYADEETPQRGRGILFPRVGTSARSACSSARTSFPIAKGCTPRAGSTGARRIVMPCTCPRTI
jgi:hypothetical protein